MALSTFYILFFGHVNMYILLPLHVINNLTVFIFNNSAIFLLLQYYEKTFYVGYIVDQLHVS